MMKWKNISIFLLILCLCVSVFAGCKKKDTTQTKDTETQTNQTEDQEMMDYTIEVKTEGGMALKGVGVYVYEDSTCEELVWFDKTDAEGAITFSAPEADGYVAVLDKVGEGYLVEEFYELTGELTEILLKVELLTDVNLAEMSFKLGDVICDFTVTDMNGTSHTLSEILKEKQAVLLNFWYVTCTPCKAEFPYLQEAYEEYSDKIEVLAMNPVDTDEAQIKAFAEELGLTFPVAACDADWQKALGIMGYPTTVMVDKHGVISLIHQGGLTSTDNFRDIFKHFTAEDYQQGVVEDAKDIFVTESDDVEINNPTESAGGATVELTVKPGEVVYLDLYRVTNMYMQIKSPNATVQYMGQKYTPTNGVIGMMVNTPDTRTPVQIGVGNTGDEIEKFTITFGMLAGSLNNPYPMGLGQFDAAVAAGNQEGVYYRYTATQDGYLTVRCLSSTPGVPYDYVLYNLNSYANRTLESDGTLDEDGNKVVKVKVSAGQVVQFSVSTLPDAGGNYPAGNFTFLSYMSEPTQADKDEVQRIIYSVTVTDANGKAMPNVFVYVSGNDRNVTLNTNDKGVAGVDLLPGNYQATIKVPAGYKADTTQVNLSEKNPTATIKLSPVVIQNQKYTVTVVDKSGKKLSGVLITVGDISATTDANGVATFNLPKGETYTAIIGIPAGYTGTMSHELSPNSTNLTVMLAKGNGSNTGGELTTYTVKVTDYSGNPISGATVTYLKDGTPVAMQASDASGNVQAQLDKGNYTVTIKFAAGSPYNCDTAAVALSANTTSVTVKATSQTTSTTESLYVGEAYYLTTGGTYVKNMQANVVNYFVFKPAAGTFRFTTTNPAAKISYHGSNPTGYIGDMTAGTDYANNAFTLTFSPDQIGDSTLVVLGVKGAQSTIIDIQKTAEYIPTAEEAAQWIDYAGTQTPPSQSSYAPTESGTLTFVDLAASTGTYNLVKGSDGFYHIGSANGKIMYVNLGQNGRYITFYELLGFAQAGGTNFQRVFYEGNQFIKKEKYNNCMKAYAEAALTNSYGIYPLTDDLIYMLKNGGHDKGWWDAGNGNYLFSGVSGLNTEIAWMFNCCYFQ